jgi:hypothetical protein
MSRMIDRMLTGTWYPPRWGAAKCPPGAMRETRERFATLVQQAEVLVVDNVAEYLFAGNDQEDWLIEKDFPNIAPPFPSFWMEYRSPTKVYSKALGDRHVPFPRGSVGIFFEAQEHSTPGGPTWLLQAAQYTEHEKGKITFPTYLWQIQVNADGTAASHKMAIPILPWSTPEEKAYAGHVRDTMGNAPIFPCLLALSFLHCKNVKVEADTVPQEMARTYERRNKRPLIRYKTLEITPMREVLRREGQSESTGLKRALHICRGHFATYSEDRPLFGRVSGTFWKPAHVRGSIKQGAVIKDYAVKQPAGA